MNLDNIQLGLQVISVIIIPIFAGLFTWITSSLKKMNERVDNLEENFYNNELKRMDELSRLAASMAKMEAKQEHVLDITRKLEVSVNRMETWLMDSKK